MVHQRKSGKVTKNESSKESNEKVQRLSSPRNQRDLSFWIALGASQVAGLICIFLVIYWSTLYGGFSWKEPKLQFFLHPLLMVLGLVFCYGEAILVFRVLNFLPKPIQKYIHSALNLLAIVLSSVGLVAVFEFHRRSDPPKADLYSLHSWIGIVTFAFFCLQYVGSVPTFLFPGLPGAIRAQVMPFHTFFGVGLFILAVASSLLGLTQRLIWTPGYTSWDYSKEKVSGNLLGIFLVIFAFLVVFLVTKSSYKRYPRKEEIPAKTN